MGHLCRAGAWSGPPLPFTWTNEPPEVSEAGGRSCQALAGWGGDSGGLSFLTLPSGRGAGWVRVEEGEVSLAGDRRLPCSFPCWACLPRPAGLAREQGTDPKVQSSVLTQDPHLSEHAHQAGPGLCTPGVGLTAAPPKAECPAAVPW